MLSNAVMFGVTLGIPLTHLSDGLQCGIPIIAWLLVFSGIYFITLIKDIIIYMVLNSSSRAKKVNQIIDLLYACIVLNFQVAWLIYGNTFVYSDAAMACRDATQGSGKVRQPESKNIGLHVSRLTTPMSRDREREVSF